MRINLQIKLISLIVLVIFLMMSFLLVRMVSREREIFQTSFKEKAEILALAFDASIASPEQLKDVKKLYSDINKFLWLYPDLIEISINVPTPDGLKVIASNRTEKIGNFAGPENIISFKGGKVFTKNITLPNGTKAFSAITPIHVSGRIVGTYEIVLSLEAEERAIFMEQKEVAKIILLSIFVIIGLLYFPINRMIIKPIIEIERGVKVIAKGNLNWRIALKSSDEIGDLAGGINAMAEKLEESYKNLEERVKEATKELEEAKSILEIKVKARTRELEELAKALEDQVKERTKELQEKLHELERFHKLAVGRELKMIQLKEEIKNLKEEIEKYKGRK